MKSTKTKILYLAATLLLAIAFGTAMRSSNASQDPGYRLMNLERRVDQFQVRLDMVERAQQNQALNSRSDAANAAMSSVLELQRMQNSLGEQVLGLQRQMLELQKQIDRVDEAQRKGDSKDVPKEPKEETKPKPRAAKP
jgi:hypothetical protein